MFADLHAHYPMRVVDDLNPGSAGALMRSSKRPTLGDRIRATVLRFANKLANFPSWDGTYRIDPEKLRAGDVGLASRSSSGPSRRWT